MQKSGCLCCTQDQTHRFTFIFGFLFSSSFFFFCELILFWTCNNAGTRYLFWVFMQLYDDLGIKASVGWHTHTYIHTHVSVWGTRELCHTTSIDIDVLLLGFIIIERYCYCYYLQFHIGYTDIYASLLLHFFRNWWIFRAYPFRLLLPVFVCYILMWIVHSIKKWRTHFPSEMITIWFAFDKVDYLFYTPLLLLFFRFASAHAESCFTFLFCSLEFTEVEKLLTKHCVHKTMAFNLISYPPKPNTTTERMCTRIQSVFHVCTLRFCVDSLCGERFYTVVY